MLAERNIDPAHTSGGPPTLSSMEIWLRDRIDPDTKLRETVQSTFGIFVSMSRTSRYKKCFHLSKQAQKTIKLSPVEFVMVAYMIHREKARMTLMELSGAIGQARREIRRKEMDVRMNTRVLKQLIAIVHNSRQHFTPDGPDRKTALLEYVEHYQAIENAETEEEGPSAGDLDGGSTPPKAKESKGKGKRVRVEDSDDEDYVPTKKGAPLGDAYSGASTSANSLRTPTFPTSSASLRTTNQQQLSHLTPNRSNQRTARRPTKAGDPVPPHPTVRLSSPPHVQGVPGRANLHFDTNSDIGPPPDCVDF